ncbi:MAG: hypothetical protein ISR48_03740 [Alphaproteobacteria bacterium]|nr:hypothetical protein [Alphaproteobacteria bacterium]
MPKTDVKKIESDDVAELGDEALDRAESHTALCSCQGGPGCAPSCISPSD